jgi:N-acetyl-gamma-glutamyl-phosphate reductase
LKQLKINKMQKINVGIIGASGYTGSELIRILINHPYAELKVITSEKSTGEKIKAIHPFLNGIADHTLVSVEDALQTKLDLVFLALPHGISMDYAGQFLKKGVSVIDLSGDFRLQNPEMYKVWYGLTHRYPEGYDTVVYGLPELNRPKIEQAKFIANPGCYPTASLLALAPLVKGGIIQPNSVIIDAKSGTTGAGVKASATTHFSNVNENFKAYNLKTHRHTIEIEYYLNKLDTGTGTLQFTPHLLPVDRGILATCYARPKRPVNQETLKDIYTHFYEDEPFIRIVDTPPSIKDVRSSNFCNIYVDFDARTQNIIVVSAIDNLVKGAAGQAVHNMNLMNQWPVKTGLNLPPLMP